jgi:hypothetical protein
MQFLCLLFFFQYATLRSTAIFFYRKQKDRVTPNGTISSLQALKSPKVTLCCDEIIILRPATRDSMLQRQSGGARKQVTWAQTNLTVAYNLQFLNRKNFIAQETWRRCEIHGFIDLTPGVSNLKQQKIIIPQ